MVLKKRKKTIIFLFIVVLVCIGLYIVLRIHNSSVTEVENPIEKFAIQTTEDKLVQKFEYSDTEFVDVYQIDDLVVINTYSTSGFDKPEQFSFSLSNKLTANDIQVKWLQRNGQEVSDSDKGLPIKVQINVISNDKEVFSVEESFVENGDTIFGQELTRKK